MPKNSKINLVPYPILNYYWVLKFGKISKANNLIVKGLSGFYIALTDIKNEELWIKFLQKNVSTKIIYSPLLRLKLNKTDLIQMNGALELVKEYSNDLIEFLLNDIN